MSFIYNLTDTWNDAAVAFTSIKMNTTDTASLATSKLMDLQVSGVSRFNVSKLGGGVFASTSGFALTASGGTPTGSPPAWSANDNVLIQNAGVTPCTIQMFSAAASSGAIQWSAPAGRARGSIGYTHSVDTMFIVSQSKFDFYGGANNTMTVQTATNATINVTGLNGYAALDIVASGSNTPYIFFQNGGSERARIYADSSSLYTSMDGGATYEMAVGNGVILGNPSGGYQGLGTLNATGVYDDGVLLTCYIVEHWKHGSIDLQKWDDLTPNTEIPARIEVISEPEKDADGKVVMVRKPARHEQGGEHPTETVEVEKLVERIVELEPARTIVRQHTPARGFATVAADRLDIDKFAADVWEKERLPAFPGPEHLISQFNGKLSTGDVLQRLWETVEVMAVHSIEARKRELALIARVDALEAKGK